MASEENKRELSDKVEALVRAKFGGDYGVAFGHYDADRDGSISKDELKAILGDAGVGSGWTRWAWAAAIIEELDADGDGLISRPEFAAVFEGGGPDGLPSAAHSDRDRT
jgi:Ca2+-binding EF-hand superfamily protein